MCDVMGLGQSPAVYVGISNLIDVKKSSRPQLSHSKLTVEIGVFALNSRDEEIQSPKAQS
jgi:hypothetical protein